MAGQLCSYTIKVRAANRRFCRSEFSEISVKTKSATDTPVDVVVDGALVGMTETHLSQLSWLQEKRKACDSKASSTSKDIWSMFVDNFQKLFRGFFLSPFIKFMLSGELDRILCLMKRSFCISSEAIRRNPHLTWRIRGKTINHKQQFSTTAWN